MSDPLRSASSLAPAGSILRSGRRRAIPNPALGVRLGFDRAAFHQRGMLEQQFVHPAALIKRRGDQHDRRLRVGLFEQQVERVERARRRLAFALRHQQRVGLKDDHDTTRRHHGQRVSRRDERRHDGDEAVAGRHIAGMDPLDVEGAQPFLHERLELVAERGLLDLVFALEADRADRPTLIRSVFGLRRVA